MAQLIQWIPLLLFLFLFVGVIIAEVFWLTRKGWATSGRSAAFVLLSDLLGLGLGSLVVFTIVLIMFMAVMGPAGTGSDIGGGFYTIAVILAVIIPPILLFVLKCLFLGLLKIKSGGPAWIYSAASSLLVLAICIIPPPVVFYVLYHLSIWK